MDDGIRAVVLMPEPKLSIGTIFEVQNVAWSDKNTLTWTVAPMAVEYHSGPIRVSAIQRNPSPGSVSSTWSLARTRGRTKAIWDPRSAAID